MSWNCVIHHWIVKKDPGHSEGDRILPTTIYQLPENHSPQGIIMVEYNKGEFNVYRNVENPDSYVDLEIKLYHPGWKKPI